MKEFTKLREIRKTNHCLNDNMREYIFEIKRRNAKNGVLSCEVCGSVQDLEIHHKRYSLDVCVADLAILCSKCHHSISDYRNFNNPERMAEMSIATV